MVTVTALAPAKINLHLAIGSRRDDGFHDLISLFHLIDLADTVSVTVEESAQLSISVEMEGMPPVAQNTMEVAARLFAETLQLTPSIHIHCKKVIPDQAGLGGGSSDAATVLLILNHLYGEILSCSALIDIGAKVGSDVPFFLGESAYACVEGRGEILTPVNCDRSLYGVIVIPNEFRISTGRAFADLDALREKEKIVPRFDDKSELITRFLQPVDQWDFSNDFRLVLDPLTPIYKKLDVIVAQFPGCFSTLSGSGSTYCVVAEEQGKIDRLRTKLEKMAANVTIYDIKSLHRGHSGDTVLL